MQPRLLIFCVLLASSVSSGDTDAPQQQEEGAKPAPPQLPAVAGGDAGEGAIKLEMGQKKALDHLGPLIINKDGTTKRVTNWDKMTGGEKEAAMNRIKERNRERVKVLKERLAREGEGDVDLQKLALDDGEL
ncbi:hypothetical protein DIPPA_35558 [Diplonema papillatum]|nr:hypothetical protein DIPPA_35558 [Diplonema papillatum]